MPNLSMDVSVTRSLLGLSDLHINDHVNYALAPAFLGATVQWNRNQVSSPFLDGAVTVTRTRQMVTETIAVEVFGANQSTVQLHASQLIDAFLQDNFVLSVVIEGATQSYQCETADYQVAWTGPRWIQNQLQVSFSVPRQPVALSGGL